LRDRPEEPQGLKNLVRVLRATIDSSCRWLPTPYWHHEHRREDHTPQRYVEREKFNLVRVRSFPGGR